MAWLWIVDCARWVAKPRSRARAVTRERGAPGRRSGLLPLPIPTEGTTRRLSPACRVAARRCCHRRTRSSDRSTDDRGSGVGRGRARTTASLAKLDARERRSAGGAERSTGRSTAWISRRRSTRRPSSGSSGWRRPSVRSLHSGDGFMPRSTCCVPSSGYRPGGRVRRFTMPHSAELRRTVPRGRITPNSDCCRAVEPITLVWCSSPRSRPLSSHRSRVSTGAMPATCSRSPTVSSAVVPRPRMSRRRPSSMPTARCSEASSRRISGRGC